ncbi:MAG: hypothetical protein AAFV93_25320, partial [Chloroflexota bacterium]
MVTTSRFNLTDRNLILTGYIEPNKPRTGRFVAQQLNTIAHTVLDTLFNINERHIELLRHKTP